MILVTGATGFIGRALIPKLLTSCSHEEIVCASAPPANSAEIKARQQLDTDRVTVVDVDLVSKEGIDQLPRSPRLTIHLAANTHTEDSDHSCNTVGVRNLMDAIKPLGETNYFIHAGTTAMFAGRKDTHRPFTENDEAAPTNEYGRSKLRGETIVLQEAVQQKFSATICRLTTVWGIGARKNSFFDVLKNETQKRSIAARLNWPGLTDFVHVDDVVGLLIRFTERRPTPGEPEVYTISAESIRFRDIAALMHNKMGIVYRPINLPDFVWKGSALMRAPVYRLEKLLPSEIYNTLWRATLVADNVIYADKSKIRSTFPEWKPKTLVESIDEII